MVCARGAISMIFRDNLFEGHFFLFVVFHSNFSIFGIFKEVLIFFLSRTLDEPNYLGHKIVTLPVVLLDPTLILYYNILHIVCVCYPISKRIFYIINNIYSYNVQNIFEEISNHIKNKTEYS